jgi:hypothetical protein
VEPSGRVPEFHEHACGGSPRRSLHIAFIHARLTAAPRATTKRYTQELGAPK